MTDTPVPAAPSTPASLANLGILRLVFEAAPIGIAISGPDLRFRLVNQKIADMLGYSREELVGLSWRDLTHPDDFEVSSALIRQLASGGDAPAVLQKRYVHRSGRTVWASLTARTILDSENGEQLTIALIEDISDQRRSEELTRALTEQTSLLASVIQKSPLAVILTNEDGEMTYLNRAAVDMLGISEAIGALGQSITFIDAGRDGRSPSILDDMAAHGRWRGERFFRSLTNSDLLPVHVTAFRVGGRQSEVGALAFVAKDIRERRRIEEELRDREVRLRQLARQLIRAQEEERARIARDLHDDVTQRLAMIAVELSFLQVDPESDPAMRSEKLETIRAQVVELTEAVRDLSHQYHPSALTHATLQAALESLCHEFESQYGVKTRFRGRGATDDVPRSIATAVYRIVQEALRNVSRHSEANRAILTLDCSPSRLHVALLDDGKGFDDDATQRRDGLGLTSMRERAATIGGTLEIHSEPGAGTRVEVTVPLAERNDDGVE